MKWLEENWSTVRNLRKVYASFVSCSIKKDLNRGIFIERPFEDVGKPEIT